MAEQLIILDLDIDPSSKASVEVEGRRVPSDTA